MRSTVGWVRAKAIAVRDASFSALSSLVYKGKGKGPSSLLFSSHLSPPHLTPIIKSQAQTPHEALLSSASASLTPMSMSMPLSPFSLSQATVATCFPPTIISTAPSPFLLSSQFRTSTTRIARPLTTIPANRFSFLNGNSQIMLLPRGFNPTSRRHFRPSASSLDILFYISTRRRLVYVSTLLFLFLMPLWAHQGISTSQIASQAFTWGTIAVLPFYTLMVLAPNTKLTKRMMESSAPYVLLGILYAYLLYLSWTPETLRCMFASKYWLPELPGIAKMFSNEMTMASAWIHLLAVDLFAARQVFHDGLKNNVETRHSVSLCLLFCPIGIVAHAVTKVLTKPVKHQH